MNYVFLKVVCEGNKFIISDKQLLVSRKCGYVLTVLGNHNDFNWRDWRAHSEA